MFIASCNYEGTRIGKLNGTDNDATEMYTTFHDHYEYETKLLKNGNATKDKIQAFLLSHPIHKDPKAIIFAFSGHGDVDGIMCHDAKMLPIEWIIKQLTGIRRKSDIPDIPILLFIDACRGSDDLWSKFEAMSNTADSHAKGTIEGDTNIGLYFATIEGHKSYEDGREGRWMPKVARHIHNDTISLPEIIEIVQKEVFESSGVPQQAQTNGSLHCGPIYFQKNTK